MKKRQTYDELEATQARAVRFAENALEDSDLAEELESLTPEEYADRRGVIITNSVERTGATMPNGNSSNLTKSDLQDICDQVQDVLSNVYQPESSREELAAAVGDALDLLENGPTDDTDSDEDDDSDDGGDDQS